MICLTHMNYPKTITVSGVEYKVKYLLAKGFSSSVRIKNGELVVKLSKFLLPWDKEKTVNKFLKWGEKKLKNFSKKDFINPVYEDGARICTHNRAYEISLHLENRGRSRSTVSDDGVIDLYFDENLDRHQLNVKIKDVVEKTIIKDQKKYLTDVVRELNDLYFAEKYAEVRFKRISSRFGSCSSKRNINIAYRLLFAPREVFRYVCVHELAHLVEFNHSKRFWSLVQAAIPDYKIHEKWLRDNGYMLG